MNPTFLSPFGRRYWQEAKEPLRSTKMLVLAANLVAIRVVLTVLSIPLPIGESLYISFQYLFNALGSLIYGPWVALLTGAAADVLAWLIAPQGPYFFPFTLTEMLSSLIFALFLFRARVSIPRLVLSKLTVNVIINILLTPVFLSMMYGKAVSVYLIPRIAKNLCLLPLESFLMAAFFTTVLPIVQHFGVLPEEMYRKGSLTFRKKHLWLLPLLLIAAAASVWLYYRVFA